jgi:hypothetical protein
MGFSDLFRPSKALPDSAPPPDPGDGFREAIRWKGEIYCQRCGSVLERVPISTRWFEAPIFDPFTGGPLTNEQRFGPTGLMVCAKWEKDRMDPVSIPYRLPSPQQQFAKGERSDHGMYYTDTPSIE